MTQYFHFHLIELFKIPNWIAITEIFGNFHTWTLNLGVLFGSSLSFSFRYRTIDMSNKSQGVDGRGLGWHALGMNRMDPNWFGMNPNILSIYPNLIPTERCSTILPGEASHPLLLHRSPQVDSLYRCFSLCLRFSLDDSFKSRC